ncbi:MAG: GreA/GreB family elongation factor [Parachlamydiales bacterium]|nr:GreA/GreB family elongation factor [Parachlamydiales bacterium]
MSYLEELQDKLNTHDYSSFLQIWEEYCQGDIVEGDEVADILQAVKTSDFAAHFIKQLPSAIDLWKRVENEEHAYQVFKKIIDLQTSNSPELSEIAFEYLQKRYGSIPHFNEKIRLVGLRNQGNFKGAISNFELLAHMDKGKFVFHTGGWGTGEIMEMSLLREQVVLEFEQVGGKKELSFENAFKNLIPLPDTHFFARRFGDPDLLEKEAKEDPAAIIRLMLKDLGKKTAGEIKDELCDWVIPEEEWSKWWQATRAKLKKDTHVETPTELRSPFRLRKTEVTHEESLKKALDKASTATQTITTVYQFVRDFPEVTKKADSRQLILKCLCDLEDKDDLTSAQKMEINLFKEDLGQKELKQQIENEVESAKSVVELIDSISIAPFKKKLLTISRDKRSDWQQLFADLFFSQQSTTLRDYLLKELLSPQSRAFFQDQLLQLLQSPAQHPEIFVWYFQKIVADESLPFGNKDGRCRFFEAFLTLIPQIEILPQYRDLVKKTHNIITNKRFANVRKIIEGTSLEYVKEFVLLVSKCQSLDDHEVKILNSLAAVVHPSLSEDKKSQQKSPRTDPDVIWTTQEGYQKTQQRVQHIGTVETVDNAKEIESARALGDLRENAEYKSALERRSRLQGELKQLSSQLNKARLITEHDISLDEIGVGNVATIKNSKGQEITYTLLGPWDADPDKNILATQSKFAQAMAGHKVGDKFSFQDEEYTVTEVKSFLG